MAGQGLVYRCAPGITWLRDADQILLVDADRGLFWSLGGVAATTWDFLTLGYRCERIVRFLSLILGASKDEAERTLVAVLRDWQDEGIVQAMGDDERGQPGD
jgi:hypothetical protein